MTGALQLADSLAPGTVVAGTVTLETKSSQGRVQNRFNFGWKPPSEGGAGSRQVELLSPRLEKAARNGKPLRAVVQPYDAFETRTAFPAG